jgi:hypothetical protein
MRAAVRARDGWPGSGCCWNSDPSVVAGLPECDIAPRRRGTVDLAP